MIFINKQDKLSVLYYFLGLKIFGLTDSLIKHPTKKLIISIVLNI